MADKGITEAQGRYLALAVEIGMVYLMRAKNEAQLRYGLEAVLTVLTGRKSVVEFREKHNHDNVWKPGEPLL